MAEEETMIELRAAAIWTVVKVSPSLLSLRFSLLLDLMVLEKCFILGRATERQTGTSGLSATVVQEHEEAASLAFPGKKHYLHW